MHCVFVHVKKLRAEGVFHTKGVCSNSIHENKVLSQDDGA